MSSNLEKHKIEHLQLGLTSSGVFSHNGLTGLSQDDHTQYLNPDRLNSHLRMGNGLIKTFDGTIVRLDANAIGLIPYFLRSATSDISGYRTATVGNSDFDAETSVSAVITNTGDIVEEWATNAGYPNLVFLPFCVLSFVVQANVNSTGGIAINLYFELYKRTSGGTETLLETSSQTDQLTTSKTQYVISMSLSSVILNATDRLVVKLRATKTGGAQTRTVTTYIEGNTAARIEIPQTSFIQDHGQFLGLSDDDHTQYLTSARADTWALSNTTIQSGVSNVHARTHTMDSVADHSAASVVNWGKYLRSNPSTGAVEYSLDFTSPTLTTPTITNPTVSSGLFTGGIYTTPGLNSPVFSDFTYATHSHESNSLAGQLDHGLANRALSLLDDDHTQYALLGGRSTGQTLIGGKTDAGSLTLSSTSHSGKGKILFGTSAYDELNNYLGLGTLSPTNKLHIVDNSASFVFNGSANSGTYTTSFSMTSTGLAIGHNSGSRDLRLQVNSTPYVTIDSAGQVGIGANNTTPDYTLDVFGGIGFTGNEGSWTTAGWGKAVIFPTNGNAIVWYEDQTTISRGIGFTSDGNLYFIRSTADDASAAPTYDMMLDANGDLSIGVGAAASYKLEVNDSVANFVARFFNDGNNTNRQGIAVACGEDSPAGTNIFFEAQEGDGTATGRLQTTGAGTFALADVSDVRLKTNVEPSKIDALSRVNGIETIEFNRVKGEHTYKKVDCGFSAQQLREVCPDAVTEYEDGTLGVMRTELIPILIKAIQEQQTLITALEARIAALEK